MSPSVTNGEFHVRGPAVHVDRNFKVIKKPNTSLCKVFTQ